MEERVVVREWQPKEFDPEGVSDIRDTISRLKSELRPSLDQVTVSGNTVTVQNLIGSARMNSGAVLEVEPKVPGATDWAHAVVQLLERDTRIAVTGSQRSTQSPHRNDLSTA